MSSSSFRATGDGLKQLQQLAEQLKARPHVDVGVSGKRSGPAGGVLDNETLATMMEFGTSRAPARSFLRSTADRQGKAWQALSQMLLSGMVQGRFTLDQALGLLGEKAVADIRATITRGIPPPNAPSTIARKGSSTPLIDSGQLLKSLSYATSRGQTGPGEAPAVHVRSGQK